jgi:hypothetical protein
LFPFQFPVGIIDQTENSGSPNILMGVLAMFLQAVSTDEEVGFAFYVVIAKIYDEICNCELFLVLRGCRNLELDFLLHLKGDF